MLTLLRCSLPLSKSKECDEMPSPKDLIVRSVSVVEDKKKQIQLSLQHAQDALTGETKSSAGDKYETSREMVQQDIGRLQNQLRQVEDDVAVLQQLQDDRVGRSAVVRLGSIVRTDAAVYFLAVSIGRIAVEDGDVYVISTQAPLARLLIGKKCGDEIAFQGKVQRILAVE